MTRAQLAHVLRASARIAKGRRFKSCPPTIGSARNRTRNRRFQGLGFAGPGAIWFFSVRMHGVISTPCALWCGSVPTNDPALLAEHRELLERSRRNALTEEETARLELLGDVLLELGALSGVGGAPPGVVRPPRIDAVLEVSFTSPEALGHAYSSNIGTGGIAITTNTPLQVGTFLELRIPLSETEPHAVVCGTVAWVKGTTAGVAFSELPPQVARRVKEFVAKSDSLAAKVKSLLTTDVRAFGRAAPAAHGVAPLTASVVDQRPRVSVALSDAALSVTLREVLHQTGVAVVDRATLGTAIEAAIADMSTAHEVLALSARVPIILVNVSGPDALTGKLAAAKFEAYVKRPASASAIAAALARVLAAARR